MQLESICIGNDYSNTLQKYFGVGVIKSCRKVRNKVPLITAELEDAGQFARDLPIIITAALGRVNIEILISVLIFIGSSWLWNITTSYRYQWTTSCELGCKESWLVYVVGTPRQVETDFKVEIFSCLNQLFIIDYVR